MGVRWCNEAALALLLASGFVWASSIETPEQVSAEIKSQGAQAFFAKLSDQDTDVLFDKIGSGQATWVALAPDLAPGADAANAEGLGIALADALPKNAAAVLSAVDPQEGDGHILAVSRVCGIPFVDEVPKDYKAKAMRAVKAVKTRRLQAVRARCLKVLERS